MLEHYYTKWNYGRKSSGVTGLAGVVLNLGKIRWTIVEANVILGDKSLFSDSHDASTYYNVNSGVAFRVFSPK